MMRWQIRWWRRYWPYPGYRYRGEYGWYRYYQTHGRPEFGRISAKPANQPGGVLPAINSILFYESPENGFTVNIPGVMGKTPVAGEAAYSASK